LERRPPAYAELLRPEGPIVFAGEHLSYQPAWQEGAVLAAHEALKLVHSMVAQGSSAAARRRAPLKVSSKLRSGQIGRSWEHA
jgi:hypothetical protein